MGQEVLPKLCLLSRLIKICRILYTVCREKWNKLSKNSLYKRNTCYLKSITVISDFGIDNSSLFRGKSQVPKNLNLNSFKVLTLASMNLVKSAPMKWYRPRLLLCFHYGLWKSLGLSWPSTLNFSYIYLQKIKCKNIRYGN